MKSFNKELDHGSNDLQRGLVTKLEKRTRRTRRQ